MDTPQDTGPQDIGPKSFDRDPETGAPKAGKAPFPANGDKSGADEGGVKSGQPVAPVPSNQTTATGMTGEAEVDPSISIESINGEGEAAPNRSDRAGGMIGEGGS